MADIKRNQKYNKTDTFESLRGAASDLAGTFDEKPARTSRGSDINLDQYRNVRNLTNAGDGQGESTQPQPSTRKRERINVPSFSELGTVTTPYGGKTKFESPHPGVDVAMNTGQPVPAFSGGRVTNVRTNKKQTPDLPGFGNYVIIEDEQGNKHRYSHLHETWVQEGQEISAGDTIGGAGHSGGAYSTTGGSGTHLDYRIKNAYNKYVNPSDYLTGKKISNNKNNEGGKGGGLSKFSNKKIALRNNNRIDFLPKRYEGIRPRQLEHLKTRNDIYQNTERIYSPVNPLWYEGSKNEDQKNKEVNRSQNTGPTPMRFIA